MLIETGKSNRTANETSFTAMPRAKAFTIITAFGKPDPPIQDNFSVIRIKY
jgi:hypothetical protein